VSEQLLLIIVEASLRALLLAALVGALLLLLRVPRGAPRHSAWLVVVVGMLAMPLLQRLAPALPNVPAPRLRRRDLGLLRRIREPSGSLRPFSNGFKWRRRRQLNSHVSLAFRGCSLRARRTV
jgi:hypothetical protein